MKLKLDEAGHVVVVDGKPVYTHDDGKDVPFDAVATVATISRLNGEAKGHREAKEAAETKLKGFEGIEDPDAAKKALETIANIDAGQLLTAGKVDEIKRAAVLAAEEQVKAAQKAADDQIKDITGQRDTLKGQLDSALIGGSFANSKFVAEKVAVPKHMLQSTYGQNFKVEDGKVVPYDASGNKLFSRARPGEVADFEEALELLISADPFKDHILKGQIGAGGGANNGGGGNSGGKREVRRADFDKMEAGAKASLAGEVREGKAAIVD
ncbi:MAG: hypothetical protein HY859_09585 [Caulobacterales bacterium]|nr:hypothetical protein [Caulobacterales bacterium]